MSRADAAVRVIGALPDRAFAALTDTDALERSRDGALRGVAVAFGAIPVGIDA